jgi:hypothetical protein
MEIRAEEGDWCNVLHYCKIAGTLMIVSRTFPCARKETEEQKAVAFSARCFTLTR